MTAESVLKEVTDTPQQLGDGPCYLAAMVVIVEKTVCRNELNAFINRFGGCCLVCAVENWLTDNEFRYSARPERMSCAP